MKDIVFATHNPNKLKEIRQMLPTGLQVLSLDDIGCTEEIAETATTLEGNARLKASHVFEQYGYDCFADDTGLEVTALDGAPGVFSARFAGPGANSEANTQKLLGLLEDKADRKARFRTVITLVLDGVYHVFEGEVEGDILRHPTGSGGFGYDPVFRPKGYDCSFAEMPLQEKNRISHRGRAFRDLSAFMRKNLSH
ncbi:MAG: non-canonical purine NTP diphosphatase [Robiginitalea sp.]